MGSISNGGSIGHRKDAVVTSLFLPMLLFTVIPVVLDAAPVTTISHATGYLRQYGHMKSPNSLSTNNNESPMTDLKLAIIRFQRFASLPQTGVLDAETLRVMSLSRCGVPDTDVANGRTKRYAVGGSPWPTNRLTYSFRSYSRKMNQFVVRNIISRAFESTSGSEIPLAMVAEYWFYGVASYSQWLWTNASGVQFTEVPLSLSANIRLQYSGLNHGDGFPFDGPGGVLAHTFYPNSGSWSGDAHFDDDENWTEGVNRGINMLQVATHELGHALGLGHSSDPNSVMNPFYSGYNPDFRLGQDDIDGINYLYGLLHQSSSTTVAAIGTSTTSPRAGGSQSAVCNNATVDAIVSVNNTIYVFKGNTYYLMDCCNPLPSIRNGFPRPLSSDWPGLNVNGVDAAVYVKSTSSGRLYLFSGQMYWRYSSLPSTSIDPGYPRAISSGFPGVPDNVDTAFVWGMANRTYFIKGALYYRYANNLGVEPQFPKPVSLWVGLPTNQLISAAFRSPDMKTYFFIGTSFYELDDVTFKVGNALSTANYWFNCSTTT